MDLEEKLYREGLSVASFGKRVYAYTIDELLISMIIIIAFYNQIDFEKDKLFDVINMLNSFILYFFILKTTYHTIFIHLYGKTIGKMVARIKAVDIDLLDNPSWGKSFLRAVFRNFDEMFFGLGMWFALTNPFLQTIHDKISKVIVIND